MIRHPPTGTGRQVIDLIGDFCRGGTDIKPLLLTLVLFGWRLAGGGWRVAGGGRCAVR